MNRGRVKVCRFCEDKSLVIDGKKEPAKNLAKRLQVSEAALTGYHSGRKSKGGEKRFPKIPLHIQQEILRLTGTSREAMLSIGRDAWNPLSPRGELISITDTRIDRRISPENLPNLARLRRRSLEFGNQILGTEIVQSLIEIEKIDPVMLKEIQDVLKVRLTYLRSRKSPDHGLQETSSGALKERSEK